MSPSSTFAWPKSLIAVASEKALLSDHGDHGFSHWARVRHHGVALARIYGVNPWVPSLFGLFHDCRRVNEYVDPGHGPRAGALVEELAASGRLSDWLSSREAGWLAEACEFHSDGLTQAAVAIQVCWDADRLDLGRVGIRPVPDLLCTAAAQDPDRIDRAYAWSRGEVMGVPDRMEHALPTARLRPGPG